MTNNANIKSVKFSTYRNSYIMSGVLLGIIFLLSLILLNFVSYQASGVIMGFIRTASYISAFICALITCTVCAKVNKIRNPDIYTPPRDTFYYLKRMGFFVVMVILMSFAVSLAGMFVNALFGGFINNSVSNTFLRGFLLKLPLFVLYLSFIYKMFVRYGFMDSQRKIFNLNFKMISVVIALIIMIPDAVFDSMFFTSLADAFIINVQTVLSPNVDIYIVESDGFFYFNEGFNIIPVAATIIPTFLVQTFVAWFAYRRGKQIFIKEHIREMDEYAMDENI